MMEARKISLSGTRAPPKFFEFQHNFPEAPLVFILADSRGGNPAAVRIKDVSPRGFRATLVEPKGNDGPHATQQLSYLAVTPGVHSLPDGRVLEAGSLWTRKQQAGRCRRGGLRRGWERVNFNHQFDNAPTFITMVQTMTNEDRNIPKTWSGPWMTVAATGVRPDSARVSLERAETSRYGKVRDDEMIGYLAIESGSGEFRSASGAIVKYGAALSGRKVRGWSNGADMVHFGTNLGTNNPLVVGSQASRYGGNGGWLRLKNANRYGARVRIDEDRACDGDRSHTTERVSILGLSREFHVHVHPAH